MTPDEARETISRIAGPEELAVFEALLITQVPPSLPFYFTAPGCAEFMIDKLLIARAKQLINGNAMRLNLD